MRKIEVPGDPPVQVDVVTSTRARRLSLRISRSSGQAKLSLPKRATWDEAVAFVREKESWIRKHVAAVPAEAKVGFGSTVPVQGAMRIIVEGAGRRAKLEYGQISCPSGDQMVGARVATLLKREARTVLDQATRRYAAALNVKFGNITIRDTRSRWGSCSSQGNLNYSWRLIMAPPDVLNYVAAHEVAHLREMNHSNRFWAIVDDLYPGYDTQRRWLRKHGASLHSYQF